MLANVRGGVSILCIWLIELRRPEDELEAATAYRQEIEKAVAEQADRSQSTEARLKELDREIANTLAVVTLHPSPDDGAVHFEAGAISLSVNGRAP